MCSQVLHSRPRAFVLDTLFLKHECRIIVLKSKQRRPENETHSRCSCAWGIQNVGVLWRGGLCCSDPAEFLRVVDVTPAKLLLCLKAHAPTCPWCLIESCRFLSEIKLRIIGAACTQIHVDRYKSGYCRAKGAQVQSRWTIQALLFIFNSRSHSCFDIGHMGTGDVQTHIWLTAIQTLAGALQRVPS